MIFEVITGEKGNAGENIFSWSIFKGKKEISSGKASTYKEAEKDILEYKRENGL